MAQIIAVIIFLAMFILIITEIWERHIDIVNIGLHFFLKNVRPYAASCKET